MARTSARQALLSTPKAAKGRKPRTPTKIAVKDARVAKGTPGSSGKRGRPAGSKGRRQSVATKMRKMREANKAKRPLATGSGRKAKVDGAKPVKVYNDELKNTAEEWEAEEIVDSKKVGSKRSYLVKWVGYPKSANTWEPEVNLRNSLELIKAFDEAFPDKP